MTRKRHAKTPAQGADSKSAEKAKVQKRLRDDWEKLQAKWAPMSTSAASPQLIPNYRAVLERRRRGNLHTAPSHESLAPVRTPFVPAPLTPKMQEREARAQEEIARKRLRVAPLYNKGGLQYVSDDTDLTTIGRKV